MTEKEIKEVIEFCCDRFCPQFDKNYDYPGAAEQYREDTLAAFLEKKEKGWMKGS